MQKGAAIILIGGGVIAANFAIKAVGPYDKRFLNYFHQARHKLGMYNRFPTSREVLLADNESLLLVRGFVCYKCGHIQVHECRKITDEDAPVVTKLMAAGSHYKSLVQSSHLWTECNQLDKFI